MWSPLCIMSGNGKQWCFGFFQDRVDVILPLSCRMRRSWALSSHGPWWGKLMHLQAQTCALQLLQVSNNVQYDHRRIKGTVAVWVFKGQSKILIKLVLKDRPVRRNVVTCNWSVFSWSLEALHCSLTFAEFWVSRSNQSWQLLRDMLFRTNLYPRTVVCTCPRLHSTGLHSTNVSRFLLYVADLLHECLKLYDDRKLRWLETRSNPHALLFSACTGVCTLWQSFLTYTPDMPTYNNFHKLRSHFWNTLANCSPRAL